MIRTLWRWVVEHLPWPSDFTHLDWFGDGEGISLRDDRKDENDGTE